LLQFWLGLLLWPGGWVSRGAETPAPVVFQSGVGRFEVAAIEATAAQRVSALAVEAWDALAAPLALPERFAPPIFARLIPAADWNEAAAFRVIVEPGGVVSLRVRTEAATPEAVVRRALVQGLLLRLAVAQHGVNGRLAAPLWLEHACVQWWQTRVAPSRMDAVRAESARLVPPGLGALFAWRRGEPEPRALEIGSLWALTFLQAESGRSNGWPALLPRLLAGDEPMAALAAHFPGRFASAVERDLWWQTGWHHLRRVNPLPTLSAADSRQVLGETQRFVFARDDGTDHVVPLAAVLERAREPLVEAELARRVAELNRLVAALHPFFRNAGLSLVEALNAKAASPAKRTELAQAVRQDWRDATELEAATTAALDALERK
jgi:hypothetical protein